MVAGFYFALLLIRAGEPVGPAQLYELKIQLVDPFHCKILPGAGSREPGAANREQTTSERRARDEPTTALRSDAEKPAGWQAVFLFSI
jgi:hypothetical protein